MLGDKAIVQIYIHEYAYRGVNVPFGKLKSKRVKSEV